MQKVSKALAETADQQAMRPRVERGCGRDPAGNPGHPKGTGPPDWNRGFGGVILLG